MFFEKIRNKITTEYIDFYDEIGWDNPFVRIFMCNYTLNGIYRRIMSNVQVYLYH